jgi:2-succinyl-6-hydroxy-2,4-cyclohexadiene-1-carboxylate synthase
MRYRVNEVCYNVERTGNGAPLVLLHGFTGSAASWDAHVPKFAARVSCIAVDFLGHGQSDAPDDPMRYSIENTAADLAALVDGLGIARAHVLGYSMGGRAALYFASKYPERVERLILESASPGLEDAAERAQRAASDADLADRIEREGIERFVEYWTNIPLFASQARLDEGARERLKEQRLKNQPQGLANSLRGLGVGVQLSLWDALASISMPTLLIAGALDVKFVLIAERMCRAMPRAQLQIVPDAGHVVHIEQPLMYDALVLEFLEKNGD